MFRKNSNRCSMLQCCGDYYCCGTTFHRRSHGVAVPLPRSHCSAPRCFDVTSCCSAVVTVLLCRGTRHYQRPRRRRVPIADVLLLSCQFSSWSFLLAKCKHRQLLFTHVFACDTGRKQKCHAIQLNALKVKNWNETDIGTNIYRFIIVVLLWGGAPCTKKRENVKPLFVHNGAYPANILAIWVICRFVIGKHSRHWSLAFRPEEQNTLK